MYNEIKKKKPEVDENSVVSKCKSIIYGRALKNF